jgi:hypothetical protein
LLASLVVGCKKEPIAYVPPDGSYGLIYTKILATTCALSGCHTSDDGATYPSLEGAAAYAAIVNGAAHNSQAHNQGLTLVKPSDPAKSFLYQKMIFDSSAYAFGSAMPAGGLTLTRDPIAFVRAWIVAGAPESGHVADRNLIE